MHLLTHLRFLIVCIAMLWANAFTAARADSASEYAEGPPVWIVVSGDSSCSGTASGLLNPYAIIYQDKSYITNRLEGGTYVRRSGKLASDESAEISKYVEPLTKSPDEHSILNILERRTIGSDLIDVQVFQAGVSKRVSIICYGNLIPGYKIGTGEGEVPPNIAHLIQKCLSLPSEDAQEWTPDYVLLRPTEWGSHWKDAPPDEWLASLPNLDYERLKRASAANPYLLPLTKQQFADLMKLQSPRDPVLTFYIEGKRFDYEVQCIFPGQNQWLPPGNRPSLVAAEP